MMPRLAKATSQFDTCFRLASGPSSLVLVVSNLLKSQFHVYGGVGKTKKTKLGCEKHFARLKHLQ
jgi:hypothetical protein